MTRLVTTGWETNDLAESGVQSNTNTTQSIVASTPTPRSPGAYCLKIAATATTSNGYRTWTLAASKTDVWLRCAVFLHAILGEDTFIVVLDSAAGTQVSVSWNAPDQLLRVYRGTNSGTLLGTSTLQFTPDAWHTVEVRWQATSATVGIVELWVDGTRWLNLTSIDNTNTTNVNMQGFQIGSISAAASIFSSANGAYFGLDDIAINDTAGTINNGQIGDGRVVLLKPNGAGSNTAQTRGGTDSGANWSQVDELPPSMTDYVYSATVGTRDTYALEDMPSGSWSVNCVEVLALAMNSDTGTGSLGLTVKSGATTNEGAAQNLATSAQYFRQLYETDPATSVAWTNAAVTALEAGTTVR